MIFRRRKHNDTDPAPDSVGGEEVDAVGADAVDETVEEAADDEQPDDQSPPDGEAGTDWEALDAQEWREDGPYDVDELDPADDADDRLDLGGVLIRGFGGMELRLQVAEETQQIVSVMLLKGESALEVAAFAAPRSGGLWTELRGEIIDAATGAGGTVGLVEGPFGTELRRLLPMKTPDGQDGYQASRMWVAQGPRWLLRGIVYGEAATVNGVDDPAVAELLDAFRAIIVRRGEAAMAPGDLLPLQFPKPLVVAEDDEEDGEGE